MPGSTPPSLTQRLACRERPDSPGAMAQTWTDLLFAHWEVPPEAVQRTLPAGLTVDTWEGRGYLGVVPFWMRHIRPIGLPSMPWLSNFLELNVRTYVYDRHGRPGVWFYSLDCNQPVAVKVARTFFHIPYYHAEMRVTEDAGRVHYTSRRHGDAATSVFDYHLSRETKLAEPGTPEFFLVERYLLFAQTRNGLRWGQIYHTPYPVAQAEVSHFDTRLFELNDFAPLTRPPDHVMGSPSVSVIFYALQQAGG